MVDRIEFADGTVWDYDYVSEHWNSVPGEGGGETIDGNEQDNSLSGTDGDDILLGYDGDDSLFGNGGNDWIEGAAAMISSPAEPARHLFLESGRRAGHRQRRREQRHHYFR